MTIHLSVRSSMDRRNCIGCNSPHGTIEFKIVNVVFYFCRSCWQYVMEQPIEGD